MRKAKRKQPKTTLVLKTVSAEMSSFHDASFRYPKRGRVAAKDWDGGIAQCGGGLHGLEMGVGDGSLLNWEETSIWLVLRVADTPKNLVRMPDKVKFKTGSVVYAGPQDGAIAYILKRGGDAALIVSGQATAGYRGRARCGDEGILAIQCWDEEAKRYRLAVGYVGEGCEANVWYIVVDGKLTKDANQD